jgi:hypothetical protein
MPPLDAVSVATMPLDAMLHFLEANPHLCSQAIALFESISDQTTGSTGSGSTLDNWGILTSVSNITFFFITKIHMLA